MTSPTDPSSNHPLLQELEDGCLSPLERIFWNDVFPWLCGAVPWIWGLFLNPDAEDDMPVLFLVCVVPIITCIIRASNTARRIDGRWMASKRIRATYAFYQCCFAIGLLVLMFFEIVSSALAFAKAPVEFWLAAAIMGGVFVPYWILMKLADYAYVTTIKLVANDVDEILLGFEVRD